MTRHTQRFQSKVVAGVVFITSVLTVHAVADSRTEQRAEIVGQPNPDPNDPNTSYGTLSDDIILPNMDVPGSEEHLMNESMVAGAGGSVEWHDVIIVKALPPGANRSDGKSSDQDIRNSIQKIDEYYRDRTDGQVRYRLQEITDWTPVSACKSPTDRRAAQNMWGNYAKQRGLVRQPKLHVMLWVPRLDLCGGPGLGEVGPTRTFGGFSYVAFDTFRADLAAHELGHNMSLLHSNKMVCQGTRVDAPHTGGNQYTNDCRVQGYMDWYDIMGISWSPDNRDWGTLNPIHYQVLGLRGGERQELRESKLVTIGAAHQQSGNARYPIVVDPTGVKYFLEYRSTAGVNSNMERNRLGTKGLLIRRVNDNPATHFNETRESLLLDLGKGNPQRPAGHVNDNLLTANGRQFVSASGRVQIQVMEAHDDRAVLKVMFDGKDPAAAKPPPPAPAPAPGPGGKKSANLTNQLQPSPNAGVGSKPATQLNATPSHGGGGVGQKRGHRIPLQ